VHNGKTRIKRFMIFSLCQPPSRPHTAPHLPEPRVP
jgi:hypothetical protein